jgi:putative MATE family efflux protein
MRLPPAPLRHPHDAEILRLAVPAFGALVAEPLFLLADSAIVGHLGTPQLAGLGVASTILGAAVSLSIFLAYGTTARVARMLGAGDQAGALRCGVDGLWLALALGAVLALLGLPASRLLVEVFGPGERAAGYAVTYLRISLAGLPAMLLVMAMTGVLRGLQDTRTPLFVATAANLANVGLNLLLVYGLELGIAGSALGTLISQWASAAVYVWVVARGARSLAVSLAPHLTGIMTGFTTSAPLILRNLSLRLVIALATAVASRLGSSEVAAHQIAFTLWSTLALGLDAVAIAGQSLVGRYLGAQDVRGAREATGRMIEWSIGIGVVLGLVLLLTPDQHVRDLLSSTLLVVALLQPLAGWVFALDGVLIGAGDLRYLASAQVITVAVFVPLAALVLALDLGLSGLWWAIGAWMLARWAVLAVRERGNAWAVTGAVRA